MTRDQPHERWIVSLSKSDYCLYVNMVQWPWRPAFLFFPRFAGSPHQHWIFFSTAWWSCDFISLLQVPYCAQYSHYRCWVSLGVAKARNSILFNPLVFIQNLAETSCASFCIWVSITITSTTALLQAFITSHLEHLDSSLPAFLLPPPLCLPRTVWSSPQPWGMVFTLALETACQHWEWCSHRQGRPHVDGSKHTE